MSRQGRRLSERQGKIATHKHGITTMFATLLVFGLAALMIIRGYEPVIIAGIISATSLGAAELAYRIKGSNRSADDVDKD